HQCRFCLLVLRCEPNSANILNLFFTNEIIFATVTCPLRNPFYSDARAPPAPASSRETVAMSVGRLLEEGHYTRQKLNEEVSRKFLQTYLELLDFSHLFFTQKDVDELSAKYGSSIAGDVLLGTLKPAYEVYALYTKRVDDRV